MVAVSRICAAYPCSRVNSLFRWFNSACSPATLLCCCAQISVAQGVIVSQWIVISVCGSEGEGNETEGNKDEGREAEGRPAKNRADASGRRIQRSGVSRFGRSLQDCREVRA